MAPTSVRWPVWPRRAGRTPPLVAWLRSRSHVRRLRPHSAGSSQSLYVVRLLRIGRHSRRRGRAQRRRDAVSLPRLFRLGSPPWLFGRRRTRCGFRRHPESVETGLPDAGVVRTWHCVKSVIRGRSRNTSNGKKRNGTAMIRSGRACRVHEVRTALTLIRCAPPGCVNWNPQGRRRPRQSIKRRGSRHVADDSTPQARACYDRRTNMTPAALALVADMHRSSILMTSSPHGLQRCVGLEHRGARGAEPVPQPSRRRRHQNPDSGRLSNPRGQSVRLHPAAARQ